MVDCPDRHCPVCKGPMAEQKKSACSGRCRAALSRRMRAEAQDERDQRIRQAVEVLEREIGPSRTG